MVSSMKLFFYAVLFLSSVSASAQTLLLDSACKIKCLVGATEVDDDQGSGTYHPQYKDIYIDFTGGLTRKQLELKTEDSELDKLCKKAFGKDVEIESHDCWNVKH